MLKLEMSDIARACEKICEMGRWFIIRLLWQKVPVVRSTGPVVRLYRCRVHNLVNVNVICSTQARINTDSGN